MPRYYIHGDYDEQINEYFCFICHCWSYKGFYFSENHFNVHSEKENLGAYQENVINWDFERNREPGWWREDETYNALEQRGIIPPKKDDVF